MSQPAATAHLYRSAITGTVHATRTCSMTRRNHAYNLAEAPDFTPGPNDKLCQRCKPTAPAAPKADAANALRDAAIAALLQGSYSVTTYSDGAQQITINL